MLNRLPRFSFDTGLTIGMWIGLPGGFLVIDLVRDPWTRFVHEDLPIWATCWGLIGVGALAWRRWRKQRLHRAERRLG